MAEADFETIALSPVRKVIAARMVEAKQTIPHFRLVADFDVGALLTVRDRLNQDPAALRTSLNDLLVKACARALVRSPAINIQWRDGAIRRFRHADISVVMATSAGLTTPIIKRAESKDVRAISQEVVDVADRAARGTLAMPDIYGGTFSLSNLGMFGVEQFDAIINEPQCAILAVGVARNRWVVDERKEPRVATLMRATLAVDHRAIDGAEAAKFLSLLRDAVEDPDWIGEPQ